MHGFKIPYLRNDNAVFRNHYMTLMVIWFYSIAVRFYLDSIYLLRLIFCKFNY